MIPPNMLPTSLTEADHQITKQTAVLDIDFIAVEGDLEDILTSPSCLKLIGSANGCIKTKFMKERIMAEEFSYCVPIASFGSLNLSIPLKTSKTQTLSTLLTMAEVESLLVGLATVPLRAIQNRPVRDLCKEILDNVPFNFESENLVRRDKIHCVLYQYGQKLTFNCSKIGSKFVDIPDYIQEILLDDKLNLSLAIAGEFSLPGAVMFCSNLETIKVPGAQFYPVVLNSNLGNVKFSRGIPEVPNSYQGSVYNTSHHTFKTVKFKVGNIISPVKSPLALLLDQLQLKLGGLLADNSSLIHNAFGNNNSLRVEFYIKIRDLDHMVSSAQAILDYKLKLDLSKVDSNSIVNAIEQKTVMLQGEMNNLKNSNSSTCSVSGAAYMLFMDTLLLYLSYCFGRLRYEVVNNLFQFRYSVSPNFFNGSQATQRLLNLTVTDINSRYYILLNSNNSWPKFLKFLLLVDQYLETHNDMHLSFAVTILLNILKDGQPNIYYSTQATVTTAKLISLNEMFTYLSSRCDSKSKVIGVMSNILSSLPWQSVKPSFANVYITIKMANGLFTMFHGQNEAISLDDSTFPRPLKLLSTFTCYDEFKLSVLTDPTRTEPILQCIINIVNCLKAKLCAEFRNEHPMSVELDGDIVLRIFLCYVPGQQSGNELGENWLLMSIFKTPSKFYSFVKLLILWVNEVDLQPQNKLHKSYLNMRDNIGKGSKYWQRLSFTRMVYFLGIYHSNMDLGFNVTLVDTLDEVYKKLIFDTLLLIENRPKLLGKSRRDVSEHAEVSFKSIEGYLLTKEEFSTLSDSESTDSLYSVEANIRVQEEMTEMFGAVPNTGNNSDTNNEHDYEKLFEAERFANHAQIEDFGSSGDSTCSQSVETETHMDTNSNLFRQSVLNVDDKIQTTNDALFSQTSSQLPLTAENTQLISKNSIEPKLIDPLSLLGNVLRPYLEGKSDWDSVLNKMVQRGDLVCSIIEVEKEYLGFIMVELWNVDKRVMTFYREILWRIILDIRKLLIK